MRDTTDNLSNTGRRSIAPTAEVDYNAQNKAALSSLLVNVGTSAANEVMSAAQLNDEDIANVEAVQGANKRVQESQIREQSTGLDRLLGKQSNRLEYAEKLASRNAADGQINAQTQALDQNAHLKPESFVSQATEDANKQFESIYDGDEDGLNSAKREFQRSLPGLANKHAAHHANYLQTKVWDESVAQYSNEMADVMATLSGKSEPVDMQAAQQRADTFFTDDYSVGEEGNYSQEATTRQKAEAVRQQVAAGNSFFYAQARDSGWLDKVAKLEPEVVAAINVAKDNAVSASSEQLDVIVTTSINDAIETKDAAALTEAMQSVNGYAERGFDTPKEQLLEQNYRRQILLAHTKVQGKRSAEDIKIADATRLLEGANNPALVAQYGKATKQKALDILVMHQAKAAMNGAGAQVTEVDPEVALDMVLRSPTMLSNVFSKGLQLGEMSTKVRDAMDIYFTNPKQFYDAEGLGFTDKGRERIVAFAAAESVDPVEFASFLGNDGMARYQIIKNGAGGNVQQVEAQLAAYETRKGNPVGMTVLDSESPLNKREWVAQKLRLPDNASPAVVDYYTDLFNTGFAVAGTTDGAINWTKRYANQVDSTIAGAPVRNGKLYESVTGNSLDTLKGTLEGVVDATGNTILTDMVASSTSEYANIRHLSQLDGLRITADPVSGDIVLVANGLQAPIIIGGDEMAETMALYQQKIDRQTANKAMLDARTAHYTMFYQKPLNNNVFSFDTEGTVKDRPADMGWEAYMQEAGREGKKILRNLGITPTVEQGEVAPMADLIEVPEVVPAVEEAPTVPKAVRTVDIEYRNRGANTPAAITKKVNYALNHYNISAEEQGALLQNTPEALQIIRHEGYKPRVYLDSNKAPTWGFGFLLDEEQLATGEWVVGETVPSRESAMVQLETELLQAKDIATGYLSIAGVDEPSDEMLAIMTNMAYNHGQTRLSKYEGLSAALHDGNATQVIEEMKDSAWYRSYEGKDMDRAAELVSRMEDELLRQGDWNWE